MLSCEAQKPEGWRSPHGQVALHDAVLGCYAKGVCIVVSKSASHDGRLSSVFPQPRMLGFGKDAMLSADSKACSLVRAQ